MQLVYAIAVVDYLKATHHVAGDACALFVADALADRVVLALGLSQLVVVVALGLEPSFDGFDVVLALCGRAVSLAVVDRHLLGVEFAACSELIVVGFLLQQVVEVGDQLLERNGADSLCLQRGNSHLIDHGNLIKNLPQDLVHPTYPIKYICVLSNSKILPKSCRKATPKSSKLTDSTLLFLRCPNKI